MSPLITFKKGTQYLQTSNTIVERIILKGYIIFAVKNTIIMTGLEIGRQGRAVPCELNLLLKGLKYKLTTLLLCILLSRRQFTSSITRLFIQRRRVHSFVLSFLSVRKMEWKRNEFRYSYTQRVSFACVEFGLIFLNHNCIFASKLSRFSCTYLRTYEANNVNFCLE